ncbi:hypothetical protein [Bdellovibrio sp. HCB-110]|uniref:hypothetical protein n=1 Tax=Bdellovibrio sp. HCB-110 TaxID=3391182 RepID=UPI0039B3A662
MDVAELIFKTKLYWAPVIHDFESSDELLLSLTYPFAPEDTIQDSLNKTTWREVFFLFCRLFIRIVKGVYGLYSKNQFFEYKDQLFLVNTSVHLRVAQKWGYNPTAIQRTELMSLNGRVVVMSKAFLHSFVRINRLLAHFFYRRQSPRVKAFLLLNYICESIIAYLWGCELSHLCRHKLYREVLCFESGAVYVAVKNASEEKSISYCYIQHGLHDIVTVPGRFKHNFLWDFWDRDYIQCFYKTIGACSFSSLPLSHEVKDNSVKVLFVLEYGAKGIGENEMRKWWHELAKEFLNFGYEVILRPHPRDVSDWFKEIPHTSLDNGTKDIEQTLRENRIGIVVSIASAAMISSAKNGIATFYKIDSRNRTIFSPFNCYAFPITSFNDLKWFLNAKSEDRQALVGEKVKFLKLGLIDGKS